MTVFQNLHCHKAHPKPQRPAVARPRVTRSKASNKAFLLAALSAAMLLAGCYNSTEFEKHETPIPAVLIREMAKIDVDKRDPIFIRIFKKEAELEVWKQTPKGQFALLKTYEICAWSGELGPKFLEGDRQAPEGFYTVSPAQMNPNSSFHLAFNIGFPNAYDRAHERTGSFLMVHGACSSAGCYSMEDAQIEEIYALAREAFLGGQEKFQVHAFPFRMTPQNMALFREDQHMPFWRTLKVGYEHFELTGVAPKVDACNRTYIFNAKATDGGTFEAAKECPAYEIPQRLASAVDLKVSADLAEEERIAAEWATPKARKHAELVAKLQIEQQRIDKFKDRGLGYSSHLRQRLLETEAALVELGYNRDGSTPAPTAPSPATATVPVALPPAPDGTPAPRLRPQPGVNVSQSEQGSSFTTGAKQYAARIVQLTRSLSPIKSQTPVEPSAAATKPQ